MDQYSQFFGDQVGADDSAASRDGSRDSLLLSAQVRFPDSDAVTTVRVRNLSPGGLMAEFVGRVTPGDPIEIDVRGVGWVDGYVAWVAEGRIGVAFGTPIDPLKARKPVAVTTKPPPPAKRGRAVL